ncbi:hypothetical protein D3C75_1096300 [compost metagenome]
MQLKANLHVMLCCECAPLRPVRNHFVLPLPCQNFLVIVRPGSNRPVRVFGIFMVARAAGECINYWNTKLLRQFYRVHKILVILAGKFFLRVQRIAVAAQGTDHQTA